MQKLFLGILIALFMGLASAQTHVELILDASGSMWNQLDDGEYRIVAAKDVLSSFVSGLPADPNLNVGLRVYGSQIPANEAGACEDSQLFVPINGVERTELLSAVRDTQAKGATPIAYSLELAGQDLLVNKDSDNVIVLVTDGEESCGGDVRASIEALKAQGIKFDLQIIGFDLNERAIESFEGLGTFQNATNAQELASALGSAVEVVEVKKTVTYLTTVMVTREGSPTADGVAVDFIDAVTQERFGFEIIEAGTLTADLPAGSYSTAIQDAFTDKPLNFSGLNVTPDSDNSFNFELVAESEVTLTVTPSEPVTGSTVTVAFENSPAAEGKSNWITIVPVEMPDQRYLKWAYVESGNGQVDIQIPGEVGTLEARYHLELPEGGSRVIGRSAVVTSVEANATLTVPAEVAAGTAFDVVWTGPDNEGDYITLVAADEVEGRYGEYNYTPQGSPATFTAPITAGNYEIRYQSNGTTGIIARQAFTVIASAITIDAPDTVMAGSRFDVSWTGPNGEGDYITIVPLDESDGAYASYGYMRDGPTLTLAAGIEAGDYEIRYQSNREDGVFARIPIAVTAMSITMDAPETVAAGSSFDVSWTGPNGKVDYLTIVSSDAADGAYGSYTYTREGSTISLTAPDEAGSYEIRYQISAGAKVFARIPITVE